MRLHVVYDQRGEIVAASEETQNSPIPQAGSGHTYDRLDVPTHLEKLGLQEIVRQVRVDAQSKRLVAKA